ncbi:MAG: hypothetical protein ACI8PZ_001469 [Myxococcota bacterium]|jgi:hypothetical protein
MPTSSSESNVNERESRLVIGGFRCESSARPRADRTSDPSLTSRMNVEAQ